MLVNTLSLITDYIPGKTNKYEYFPWQVIGFFSYVSKNFLYHCHINEYLFIKSTYIY